MCVYWFSKMDPIIMFFKLFGECLIFPEFLKIISLSHQCTKIIYIFFFNANEFELIEMKVLLFIIIRDRLSQQLSFKLMHDLFMVHN